MPGTASDYTVERLMKLVWQKITATGPANIYLGLSRTVPTTAGGNITNPANWTNYARKEIVAADVDVAGLPASREIDNLNELDFGTAAASADETLNGWYLADHLTASTNILWVGSLPSPVIVQNGNPVKIPIAALIAEASAAFGTPT